ncbi:hypothetical protein [Pyrobaculum genetic element 1]|nr:hypothetical protein [Pyrobaculum genetic element 1]
MKYLIWIGVDIRSSVTECDREDVFCDVYTDYGRITNFKKRLEEGGFSHVFLSVRPLEEPEPDAYIPEQRMLYPFVGVPYYPPEGEYRNFGFLLEMFYKAKRKSHIKYVPVGFYSPYNKYAVLDKIHDTIMFMKKHEIEPDCFHCGVEEMSSSYSYRATGLKYGEDAFVLYATLVYPRVIYVKNAWFMQVPASVFAFRNRGMAYVDKPHQDLLYANLPHQVKEPAEADVFITQVTDEEETKKAVETAQSLGADLVLIGAHGLFGGERIMSRIYAKEYKYIGIPRGHGISFLIRNWDERKHILARLARKSAIS